MTKPRKTRLSDAEIASFRDEGLVIPDYRIPDEMLSRMRAEVDDLIARHPDVRPELLSGPHNPWGQSAKLVGSWTWLEFCRFHEIVDMVEQLIGPDVILWGSQLFCKPASHGMAVPWHQDGQYWPLDPLATVTVRIAIEERVSMSPDALTGLEANLRFNGPENMLTRVFARLTAWQNWIFQRPNAVGDKGALKVYGKGEKAAFDWHRV